MPNIKVVRLPELGNLQIVSAQASVPDSGWAVLAPGRVGDNGDVYHNGEFVGCFVRYLVERRGQVPFAELIYEPMPPED
jgi:hypothetical protein